MHGVYSVVAAKEALRAGRVMASRPLFNWRQQMQLHLRQNKIKSVTLEPYALAAEEGEDVVDGFTTMNSLRTPPIDHPTKRVIVDTISLDAYLDRKQIDRVDLLK